MQKNISYFPGDFLFDTDSNYPWKGTRWHCPPRERQLKNGKGLKNYLYANICSGILKITLWAYVQGKNISWNQILNNLSLKEIFQFLLKSKVKIYALKTTRFFHSNGLISFSVFRVNLCANIVDLWSWNTWFPSLTALLNQLRDKTRNFCIKLKRKTNYNHNLLLCTLIPKTLPLRKSGTRNKEYYSFSYSR